MTDIEALTLTIWGEARGEPIEGKIGVAMVIRNRLLSHYRGAQTYVDVCTAQAQFSAWSDEVKQMQEAQDILVGDPSLAHHPDPALRLCLEIAQATIPGLLSDNTAGANHYLTTDLYRRARPAWAVGEAPRRRLGHHIFLKVP